MRKSVFAFYLILFYIWSFSIFNAVKADEYNKVVIGHIMSETLKGSDIDTTSILENELEKLAHKFVIDSISILQAYLPQILEGVAADLRLQTDKKYKEELLNGENSN